MRFATGDRGHLAEHNRLVGRDAAALVATDYDSLQDAVDALPFEGGTVLVPPGTHGPVATNKSNVRLIGSGASGQSSITGFGATIIEAPNGGWGIKFAEAAASHNHLGPKIEGIHIRPASGATPAGGIWIDNASNARLVDCTVSGMTSGIGIRCGSASGTSASQYHELRGVVVLNCQTGIDLVDTNGCRIIGGFIEYYVGGQADVTPGTKGVVVSSASEAYMLGTIVQFQDVGVEVGGSGSRVIGCRFEATTTGVDLLAGGDFAVVSGCSVNNSIVGGTGTGVRIANGVQRASVRDNMITAVTTGVVDNRSGNESAAAANWVTKANNGYQQGAYLIEAGNVGSSGLIVRRLTSQTGDLLRVETEALDPVLKITSVGDLVLLSPDGTEYALRVANDGTLSTTAL